MGKVVASITTSIDGYIAGPHDGPGCGLGVGGERLHNWVFGGEWSYDSTTRGAAKGEDKEWLERVMDANGAVIAGRSTYEAAGHWGGRNPFGVPLLIVTHRPHEQPADGEFTFLGSFEEALERGRSIAGDRQVHVMGGADILRQAMARGSLDELTLIVAPLVLGAGKRLFEGFDLPMEMEPLGVRQSPFATFIDLGFKR